MYAVLVVSIIIVLAVLLLAVLTTSKAYTFKHTVDPLDENPNIKTDSNSIDQEKK